MSKKIVDLHAELIVKNLETMALQAGDLFEEIDWIQKEKPHRLISDEYSAEIEDILAEIVTYLDAFAHACSIDLAEARNKKFKSILKEIMEKEQLKKDEVS
jgi:NTP pyrophosphatase (non-canonical NTP hydrolase)